ncbi:CoA-binding protein [Candidatus Bathyarchaeota archaeon]|nr:CoA-binding protein [Candidatus Bathyarchaeota archaeon]MBT4320679.1 CoA-binding protein [Candidatus Bathyarchaeota archaeon]MBT4423733.1 CoA-binding protein [Candidatus Bathyarchaeota archaeon]MBT5643094.1 CoA-binding protein [Candidatus Bathyarchaeota archaeon]MBT6605595.1 CoA-binding protein [Candidatus Bathyarchaeota archaeon]
MKLDAIFRPKSVAIIGASNTRGKVGFVLANNLLKSGYDGPMYFVNIRGNVVLGTQTFKSITDIPGDVDLAVVSIPSKFVISTVEECGKKGVKAMIIISAGFKEMGGEGAELEIKLVETAKKYGIRIQGPNCLGTINTHLPLDLSFASTLPKKGSIGFITQSGALGTAILDWVISEEIGFGSIVSLGNKADLDEIDFIEAMAENPDIKVILLYLESIERGRKFLEVASEVVKTKPIMVVKGGTSSAGAKAAGSHTGALVGSFLAYQKAFDKAGVILSESMEDLFNYAVAFTEQNLPKKEGVAIVTNAGGPGILSTDLIDSLGLKMAALTESTVKTLRENLPSAASTGNPVDILGDALPNRYAVAVEATLKDPNVNSLVVLLTPQAMTDSLSTAKHIVKISKSQEKPVITVFMGGNWVEKATEYLKDNGMPCFNFPEKGIKTLNALYKYCRHLKLPELKPPEYDDIDRDAVRKIFNGVKSDGRNVLFPHEAMNVAEAYGINAPASALSKTADEAVEAADKMGYPVVMKIVSPEIMHKTDIGGVELNLTNSNMVRIAFDEIMRKSRKAQPLAKIYGITVDKMVPRGREMIIGMSRDHQFGPMVMFGLGGIYVNYLKDVAFRLAPMNEREAQQMMEETRSYSLLKGVRGETPADIDTLREAIIRVSHLVWDFPELQDLDINPIFVYDDGKGVSALDVKITLS